MKYCIQTNKRVLVFVLCLSAWLAAGSVKPDVLSAMETLVWWTTTVPEARIAGFKLHYGSSTRQYSTTIDVGFTYQYILDGLMQGVLYYSAVSVYGYDGKEIQLSNEITVKFMPPSPPRDLMLAPGLTQIELTWKPSKGNVAGYYVRRDGRQIAITDKPGYVDTGLTPDTLYTYEVRAFGRNGALSEPAGPKSARTLKPMSADADANVSIIVNVALGWPPKISRKVIAHEQGKAKKGTSVSHVLNWFVSDRTTPQDNLSYEEIKNKISLTDK